MHCRSLSLLCLLAGCLPKGTAAIDDLMQLEAFDVACTRAGSEAVARVAAPVWIKAAPTATATRLTAEEIGGVPSGWEMWRVHHEVAPGVLASSYVDLALFDGEGRPWTRCTECTQEWVARQFTPPLRTIPYISHNSSSDGGFFRGLADLGKVVLAPFTLIVDVAVVLPLNVLGADMEPITNKMLNSHWSPSLPAYEPVPPSEHRLPLDLRVFRPPASDSEVVNATFTLQGSFDGCSVGTLELPAPVNHGTAEVAR
jgi:hypothetical protein